LRAAPAFTVVAVSTLAIGIAVNTIAFTLLNSIALRPMPVRDGSRLVRIYPVDANGRRQNLFSYPDYLSYREPSEALDGTVAYIPATVTLGRDATREPMREGLAYAVSASYFPVLGIELALGRTFNQAEEARLDERVAIISYSMWQRRHDGAADALGQTVTINGRAFSIVGVGPQRFMGTEPLAADVWVPLAAQPILDGTNRLTDRTDSWLLVIGRLRPGVEPAAVERDLSLVASRLSAAYPAPDRPVRVAVAPGTFFTLDSAAWSVIALVLGAVGMVLVIACANLANLALARALSRRRDVATRLALGASRWRVIRHLLGESLLVAALGGVGGLLFSAWTLRLLAPIGLALIPEVWASVVLDLTPDIRVFTYTAALAMGAGLAFGLVPALQSSTPAIASALRDDATALGVRVGRSGLRSAMVVVQISICLMLLAAAALAARGLQRTEALDLGFHAADVVYTRADLRRHGYSRPAAADFYARLSRRAAALPGVTAVALTTHVPLTGGVTRAPVQVDGQPAPIVTMWREISPDYFRTLEIPIAVGRPFTEEEVRAKAPVAIVSEGLARRFWRESQGDAGFSAIGKRLTHPQSRVPLTVVGVARDASDGAIWREKELSVYLPISTTAADGNLHLLVKTAGSLPLVADEIGAAAAGLDPEVRFTVTRLDDMLRIWLLPSRIAAAVALVLGLLALMMASIGIYGVMSCAVAERRREIGIRIALGATAGAAAGLVMRDGVRLIALGVAAGALGALATARILSSWLPGVSPADPVALGAATAFLGMIASIACYLPARRAATVDPMEALRSQ